MTSKIRRLSMKHSLKAKMRIYGSIQLITVLTLTNLQYVA
jgi:hypothetical protein